MGKLRNIILGWWYRITGSNYELYKSRMDICSTCDKRIKILGDDYCSSCGCALKAKNRVKEEHCVENKW